jgi:hypothetical protein
MKVEMATAKRSKRYIPLAAVRAQDLSALAEKAEREARAARDRQEAEAEARRVAERAAAQAKRREEILASVPGTYRAADESIANLYNLSDSPLRDIQFDVTLGSEGTAEAVLRVNKKVRGRSVGTWKVDFEETERIWGPWYMGGVLIGYIGVVAVAVAAKLG